MKNNIKSKYIIILLIVLIAFCFLNRKSVPSKPYDNLKVSNVVSATVHLIPPDKTIPITDTEELVTYLNDIVIIKKDNSYKYKMSYGQAVTFTLTMTDGSQEKISAFYPFIIINRTGYQAEYQPCETLNSYANRLLNQFE